MKRKEKYLEVNLRRTDSAINLSLPSPWNFLINKNISFLLHFKKCLMLLRLCYSICREQVDVLKRVRINNAPFRESSAFCFSSSEASYLFQLPLQFSVDITSLYRAAYISVCSRYNLLKDLISWMHRNWEYKAHYQFTTTFYSSMVLLQLNLATSVLN